jgi:carbonic anhydrase/acetyltransferase-like protein (isoleucine patch superfamily)
MGGVMIETFDGITPRIAASAFVHPLALVRGDVQIGELCVVHPGAVINGDWAAIRIGDHVMIEDNCVLHAGLAEDWRREVGTPLTIGNDVIIGHGAVVHGTRIGDHVMIGMNATVLQSVEIADGCVIAAGAVVPEREQIPAGSFVAGVPARIKGKVSKAQSVWTGMSINKAEGLPVLIEYIRKLRDACITS